MDTERTDGRIQGIGEDGKAYYIPKQSIDYRPIDWKARILAAGGMLVGAGALIFEATRAVIEPKESVSPRIVQTVEAIQTQVYVDELMACVNEQILKDAVGFPPGDFQDCRGEAEYAATMAADKPNRLFPEITPTPQDGA